MAPLTIFKDSEPEPRTYINKHGTVSTMDTSRIGRSPSQAPYYSPAEAYPEILSPAESLRQTPAYQDDQANGLDTAPISDASGPRAAQATSLRLLDFRMCDVMHEIERLPIERSPERVQKDVRKKLFEFLTYRELVFVMSGVAAVGVLASVICASFTPRRPFCRLSGPW
jgi:hypothetical protein